MITITPQAAEQIRRAAEQGGMQGQPLRIAARKGDDGKVEYMMGFDELGDEDTELMLEGVNVLISPWSLDLLKGVTLDFVELNPGEFQFIFIPPDQGKGGKGEA